LGSLSHQGRRKKRKEEEQASESEKLSGKGIGETQGGRWRGSRRVRFASFSPERVAFR